MSQWSEILFCNKTNFGLRLLRRRQNSGEPPQALPPLGNYLKNII